MKQVSGSRAAAIGLLLGTVVSACAGPGLALSSDSSGTALFEQAQAYMQEQEWRRAAEAYDTLLRNYPTSPHLPQARLALGRAYYEQGNTTAYVLAADAFRNFLTYHPSHAQVDYAQLMIAMSNMRMMRSPDRDQTQAREALRGFEIFLEDYPNSGYMPTALENMQQVVDNLAEHELDVADFQLSRGRYAAARQRAQYGLRMYPSTSFRCGFVWILGESYRRQGDARQANTYFQRIVDEHAGCEHVEEASSRLRQGGAPRPSEDATG